MLELLLCSMLTVFPDFLYRRFVQGKRLGKEITIFSVWYELRWGITLCLMLTVSLITVVFYNHPSTSNVTAFFRVIPILPEGSGRVAEIYIDPYKGDVKKGDPIFRLDDEASVRRSRQRGGASPKRTPHSSSRRLTWRRPTGGFSRRRATTSRRWRSCRPSRNCTSAIPMLCRGARSSACINLVEARDGAVDFRSSRRGTRRSQDWRSSFPPKRPARRRRWSSRKSSCTR